MALAGRMRSQKRASSSSSSYTSTITTLTVIAFVILGVWMLSSGYMVSPQAKKSSESETDEEPAAESAKIEQRPITNRSSSFEDNSGDLPGDVLRADDSQKVGETKGNKDGDKEKMVERVEEKKDAGDGVDEKANEVASNGATDEESAHDIQVSEESSLTQNQELENASANDGTENADQQDQATVTEEEAETKTNAMDTPKQPQEEQTQPVKPVTFKDETKKDQQGKRESDDAASKEGVDEGSSSTSTRYTKQDLTILPISEIPKESKESKEAWSTQASESSKEKARHKEESEEEDDGYSITWQLCNSTAGEDYIPCLDNPIAVKKLKTTKHFEHRERHCPEEPPTCLVPLPKHYRKHIPWPESRTKIWFHNVPHSMLANFKGHQNWVKVTGEYLMFPGGGTQFIRGALVYINFIEKALPSVAWGRRTRVVLDVGCGVASFGGFLFDKDVITMSFAPKDEHEAQVQFALERGIPAVSAVMGSMRLPFPSGVFDLIHCARCRVPWHTEGGRLLLELDRMLRPGGYFVWSATPVYQKLPDDLKIWDAMTNLTRSICWKLETIQKDKVNKVAAAIYSKPINNDCYNERRQDNPPVCKSTDDPNAAWYVPLQSCMQRLPTNASLRGSKWPAEWPERLSVPPYWLNKTQMGIYGKPAPDDYLADYEHWSYVLNNTYRTSIRIDWSNVRNVMDMRAVYGGFAAALKDLKVWVMNVVNVNAPDTLPIIYERGLLGIYHDWCESFSTYPRSYDLLHADHLFSQLKTRCNLAPVMAEVDRIVRPGGHLIVRDESNAIAEVESLLKSLHWEVDMRYSKEQEGILSATKTYWRP